MKKLPLPKDKDMSILKDISKNNTSAGSIVLNKYKIKIGKKYIEYKLHRGNHLNISALSELDDSEKASLLSLYTHQPKILDDIFYDIRHPQVTVCPMCGSLYNGGTIDHYLPKSEFPELSIFTKNLVPACLCNNKRGSTFRGTLGERILHPYYDECMNERLISVTFHGIPMPRIELVCCYDNSSTDYKSVVFHIQEVVAKTNVIPYLNGLWENLCTEPHAVLMLDSAEVVDEDKLYKQLQMLLCSFDASAGTPNNWQSAFYHGLLNDNALKSWLLIHLNDTKHFF